MLLLTIPGHFPHIVVGLCHAGSITPATQLGTNLQAAPAEQFEEKHNIIAHPGGVVADEDVPHDTSPYVYAKLVLISIT
jgi:hypothetical protein